MGLRAWSWTALGVLCLACGGEPPAPAPDTGVEQDPPAVAQAACDTLRPGSLGASVTVSTKKLPPSLHGWPGTSDGAGNVLLKLDGSMSSRLFQFHAADGKPLATVSSFEVDPLPLARGFQGAQAWTRSQPYTSRLLHFSSGGTQTETPYQPGFFQQALDPTGGTMVLAVAAGELQAYDGAAQQRWRRALPLPVKNGEAKALAMGVDRQGHTLVLFDGSLDFEAGTVGGLWVDAAGNVGPRFRALTEAPGPLSLSLHPAADAGLFLQAYGLTADSASTWVGRLLPGVAQAQPVPAFLGAHPGMQPQVVRGGAAYALLPRGLLSSERCELELYDVAGNACGKLDFSREGRGCASLSVGLDGTVFIQPLQTERDCNYETNGDCSWTWSWWPGLLK